MNHQPPPPLVLVIDNATDTLTVVSSMLIRAGYACHACDSAESAAAFAHATPPDLIVCDAGLQGDGGSEVCERIKVDCKRRDLPVMLLSSAQSPDIIRRPGANYSLRKPFDPVVLVELVEQALHLTRMATVTTPA